MSARLARAAAAAAAFLFVELVGALMVGAVLHHFF